MLLYLEGHEYVAGLSPGRGARVDIHPFKTMPFVEENGISVAPGTTTYVGLRMVCSKLILFLKIMFISF